MTDQTDHRADAAGWLGNMLNATTMRNEKQAHRWVTAHLLAAIHDGQAEQTALLRALVEQAMPQGDPCPCGCRRNVDPTPEVSEYRSCLPSLGERHCGACRGLSDRHVVGCDGTWGR